MDWDEVLRSISQQISRPSFETWLSNTTAEIKEDVVIVKARNSFQADWLDSRYKSLIADTVEKISGNSIEVVIENHDDQNDIEWQSTRKYSSNSNFDEIKELITAQQEKINELEERVRRLENAEKISDN